MGAAGGWLRAVTHRDVSDEGVAVAVAAVRGVAEELEAGVES